MINLTKRKRLKNAMLLFFLAFAFCQLSAMSKAPLPSAECEKYTVKDLKAEDLPYDDGTGLLLSWEPLSADARVIEYRIYRGSKKDQLFKIASVTINPKTGFAGERVFHYDNGFNVLTTINSSMKPKREEQQPEDSPLYGAAPRDLKVIEHKFEDYMVIGIIPKKEYYHKSRLIELKGEDHDSQYYAGLKDRQFKQILSKLKADHTYYYTVVAVNEQGRFYPAAPIVEGTPRINAPEKPRRFYSVYLEDKDRMQFEWTMPIITDGVGKVSIYLLAKKDIALFNRYVEQVEKHEENRLLRCDNPDIELYKITEQNPAKLIEVKGFDPLNYSYIDFEDRIIKDKAGNKVFDGAKDKFEDYYTVISFANHWGMESFGVPVEVRELDSASLPTNPPFAIVDKPNDKGDANLIYWEDPVAFITNSVFINDKKTRITINYEYEKNPFDRIKNIYFDIYDDKGERIGKRIDKFYQDLFFHVKLPERYSPNYPDFDDNRPTLHIEMRINVCGHQFPEDYVIYQTMKYDDDYVAYMPEDPYLLGNNITNYTYNVYKKPYSGEAFRLVSRSAGVVRQADDLIRYEDSITQLLSKLQPEDQMFLVNTAINAFYDKEAKRPVNTHIFYEVVEKENEKRERELEKLTLELEETEDEQQRAQIEGKIEGIKKLLAYNEHEFMKEVNSQKNDKLRMKKVMERREEEMRTFQYKMVKSDGEALFVETEVYTDDKGNSYFFPLPNWFNKERYATLVASFLWGIIVYIMTKRAKQGKDMYIRPIAGLEEIDNAIGRATEMGRPILFNPGLDGIGAAATLAGLNILGKVAQKAAEYDTRILVPVRDVITLPIAQEIIKEAHYQAGRPDTYDRNSAFYISGQQFAFVAGVNGVMIREKCATCFYMGFYYAEALIMTEVGNTIGAVQIAGTDAVTQVPFFITTCDYTLIGEELYGASAYLSREPMMMGTLKATDVAKFIILVCMVCGTILSTFKHTFFINMFPDQ